MKKIIKITILKQMITAVDKDNESFKIEIPEITKTFLIKVARDYSCEKLSDDLLKYSILNYSLLNDGNRDLMFIDWFNEVIHNDNDDIFYNRDKIETFIEEV